MVPPFLLASTHHAIREQHFFRLVALAIAVFNEATKAVVWRTLEIVTALCVAVSLAFGVSCYFVSWFSIEWRMQDAIKQGFHREDAPVQGTDSTDLAA
jgi:hypothetical protein